MISSRAPKGSSSKGDRHRRRGGVFVFGLASNPVCGYAVTLNLAPLMDVFPGREGRVEGGERLAFDKLALAPSSARFYSS